jgi:hypothetical protein
MLFTISIQYVNVISSKLIMSCMTITMTYYGHLLLLVMLIRHLHALVQKFSHIEILSKVHQNNTYSIKLIMIYSN